MTKAQNRLNYAPLDLEKKDALIKRVESLEKENQWQLFARDLVVSMSQIFAMSADNTLTQEEIFQHTQDLLSRLLPFHILAFFLVNEESADFELIHYTPDTDKKRIIDLADDLIEQGEFAWAVQQNQVIKTNRQKMIPGQILLRTLSAKTGIRGMFIGVFDNQKQRANQSRQDLLSVLLNHCAQALENVELQQKLHQSNQHLETTLDQLTEQSQELLHKVTALEQMRWALEEARDVAQNASQAKSEFLAVMSHEIRTPLNAVIGMTDLVLGSGLENEQRNMMEIVQQSADALLILLNSVLDFSKIEAGHLELEHIEFDSCGRIENACETMSVRAHQKGINLFCHIDTDVPEKLIGDPHRLVQIIINLTNNAIKFTHSGEIVVRMQRASEEMIDFCLAKKEQNQRQRKKEDIWIKFSVSDTGIGIPEDKVNLIFEKFSQANSSTTRQYGGTGLGLAICKRLTEMMDGLIWVESATSGGSIFHFLIRLTAPTTDARGNDDTQLGIGTRQKRKERPFLLTDNHILIVESSRTNQTILHEILSYFEAIPTTINAVSALESIQPQHNFKAVLIDAQIWQEEGEALVIFFQHQPHFPKLVGLTATTKAHLNMHPQRGEHALDAVINTPVKRYQLASTLYRVLNRTKENVSTKQRRTFNITKTQTTPQHILLVEDIANNQKLATTILQQCGHTVVLAENGKEALECLEKQNFDVVLMDLHMPVMDGYEAIQRIREAPPSSSINRDVPIVVVTAYALKSEKEEALSKWSRYYLTKPYKTHALIQVIERLVSTSRIRDAAKKSIHQESMHKEPWYIEDDGRTKRETFMKKMPHYMEVITQAILDEDTGKIEDMVQRMRALSNEVGAKVFSRQILRLAMAVRRNDFKTAQVALESLTQAFQQVIDVFRK
ncbi:response regulator [Magnetococcales bacterium HHB-1]